MTGSYVTNNKRRGKCVYGYLVVGMITALTNIYEIVAVKIHVTIVWHVKFDSNIYVTG